ncbi:MAG: DsrE family protein [Pseudomonadota bacterium]|nr:MAG: DsrE family protein [Pseudomonadota bacterium]
MSLIAALALGCKQEPAPKPAAHPAKTESGAKSEPGTYEKQKVVYHINYNDEKELKGAMRNVQNHINAVGKENLDLKVVMHGNGVDLLKQANDNPDMQSTVINLKKQGIGFQVCANTLKGKKINYKNDLFDVSESDIVPSGVAEIAALQQKGYSYVKP